MQSKVTATLIVKDEPLLEAHLRKVRPYVDTIVVLDTGSKEPPISLQEQGLVDILEVAKPGEYDFYGIPIHFAKARNRTRELVRTPWMLWLDGDDEVDLSGLKALIEDLEKQYPEGALEVLLPYQYASDVLITRERLIRHPDKFRWEHPVHEVLNYAPGANVRRIERTDITWQHKSLESGKTPTAQVERNLRILKALEEHEGLNGRMSFYMARELTQTRPELESDIKKYFLGAIQKASCEEDEATAAEYLANYMLTRGKVDEAVVWAHNSISVKENWPNGWQMLARALHDQAAARGNDLRCYEKSLFYARLALKTPKKIWFGSPNRLTTFKQACRAADHLSKYEEGLSLAEEGLQEYPDAPELLYEKEIFTSVLAWKRIHESAGVLAELRKKNPFVEPHIRGALANVKFLLGDALPEAPKKTPATSPNGKKLRIAFGCSDNWEVWNPEILAGKGFGGGSEIAVIEISRRLAALGHDVTVYTNCGEERDYDGVKWRSSKPLHEGMECDVLVAWRIASLLDLPITCHAKALWLHDTSAVGATTGDGGNLAKATLVCGSKWHAGLIANRYELDVRGIEVISNGVAKPERFGVSGVKRDPHKIVSNSSPDRALGPLLRMWPRIREAVPDATLHVFYGFEMWKKMATATGNVPWLRLAEELEERLSNTPGVVYRGRVTQEELAYEMLSAGVWAYPCTQFEEIFCVAAAEAMLAGCHVVTVDRGALPEVVSPYGEIVPMGLEGGFEERFVESTVSWLKWHDTDREKTQKFARERFDLDAIAKTWDRFLWRLMAENIPAYEEAV